MTPPEEANRAWMTIIAVVVLAGVVTAAPATLGPLLTLLLIAVIVVGTLAWGGTIPLPGQKPRLLKPGARWASLSELWAAGWLRRAGGWPLGVRPMLLGLWRVPVYLPTLRQRQNVLVVAPTGQGKTASIVAPAIKAEATTGRSLIIVDPKGDLAPLVRHALAATHDVLVWNPGRPDACTVAFEPLAGIPDKDHPRYVSACERAADIYLAATSYTRAAGGSTHAGDRFWSTQAANVLKGVVMQRRETNPGESLLDIAEYLQTSSPPLIAKRLNASKIPAARLRGAVVEELLLNDKARSGVIGDLYDRFVLLLDTRVKRALGGDGDLPLFALDAFLARPTALVLQVDALTDTTLPLLSVVLATLMGDLVDRCEGGRPAGRDIRIIIDEAGNLGKIHQLPSNLALFRSYGIGQMIVTQALAQIRGIYGEDDAETIVSNCVTALLCGGTTDADAAWISKRLGMLAANMAMPSRSSSGASSTHYQRQQEPLLRPDEIRQLRYGLVVETSHLRPSLLKMRQG